MSPCHAEGELPDDVLAMGVASYSDEVGAFPTYGAHAVADLFANFPGSGRVAMIGVSLCLIPTRSCVA